MERLDMLGICPKCEAPVLDGSPYEYDEQKDEYWHTMCVSEDDGGQH